jgi:hypothetical protein
MRLAGPHAEAAEQVTSTHHALFALADDGQPGRSVRRLKLERPVRPMGVVVLEIHPKDLRQMAMVQVRRPSAGQAYYRRKLAEGKSPKEALRCLKRRLSDAVDRCLPADQRLPPSPGGIRAGASTEDGAASATCRRPGAAGARPTRRSTPGASRQCPCGAATRER